MQLSSTVW